MSEDILKDVKDAFSGPCSYHDTPNCDPKVIEETRRLALKEAAKHPEQFEQEDIDRAKNCDWTITRFLLRCRQEPKRTAKMICNTARWRKETGQLYWKDTDFPKEFYQIGDIFPYGRDRKGNLMVYLRIKRHRKLNEFGDLQRKYLLHLVNKLDNAQDGRGIAVVADYRGGGYANMDLGLLYFMVRTFKTYYPRGLSYVLLYERPWYFQWIWQISRRVLSQDNLKYIRIGYGDDIYKYVDKEELPDFLGGPCDGSYRIPPEGCPSAAEMAEKMGLSEKEIKRLEERLQECLENSREDENDVIEAMKGINGMNIDPDKLARDPEAADDIILSK